MDGNDEKRVWGIHTMNDALFLNDNIIAIGWRDMGDLKQIAMHLKKDTIRFILIQKKVL